MRPSSLYSLQFLYLLHSETVALCFYPDGQVSDDLECNPTAPETACCGRGSTCLSNGVCDVTNSSGITNYGRGSCTDSTWRSTLCPQFCQSVTEGALVYYCNSEDNWCCDQDYIYQGCCSNPNNFLNLGVGTSITVVGGSAATTTSQPTSPSTSQPTSPSTSQPTSPSVLSSSASASTKTSSASLSSTAPTPSTASQSITLSQRSTVSAAATLSAPVATLPSKSSNIGAKIGAGVGVPLGVALLAAIAYILFLKSSRSHRENKNGIHEQRPLPEASSFHAYSHDKIPRLHGHDEIPQLHGHDEIAHLDGQEMAQLPA